MTHSILLLPLWALLYSWILSRVLREPGGWRALYGITALALLAHIVGDVITSFGTIVLAPLWDWRAAVGTTFIIDLWFSGIIVAGLLVSIFVRNRIPAAAASAVLACYVGFQYLQKQEALELGRAYAASLGLRDARITAHPRPVSPFNWTVFVSDEHAHRYAHVNLVRETPRAYRPGDGFIARIDSPYLPKAQAVWVERTRYGETPEARAAARQAWESEGLAFYRWFADLPAFNGVTEGSTCVWFIDLRFLTPGREMLPFQYGACRERNDAPWRPFERLGPTTRQAVG